MAFNWQTFRTRTLTAIIFVAIMLAGLLWNQWSFLVLFSVIHFGCWGEYLRLLEKIFNSKIDLFLKYFFCICGYLIFLVIAYHDYSYDFGIVLFGIHLSIKWGLLILFFISTFAFLFQNKKLPSKLKYALIFGFIYISVSWGLMINLYKEYNLHMHDTMYVVPPIFIPLMIIASIWINDTMAYLIGSLIGKTPLSKISPKKTWEGTIGGIIFCIVLMCFLCSLRFSSFNSTLNILVGSIAGIAAITGVFGDLFESKLKRMAGVKDTGSLMPGHGGFLDRFDSLLLATPFVWLYVQLFMK